MMYRTISQPLPPSPKPPPVAAPKKVITRADVDEIIQRRRSASPEELQEILGTKDLKLTEGERNQISVDITIAVAQRSRNMNGRRDDHNAQFIAQVLRLAETPFGLVSREWVNELLHAGASAIQRCRNHRPPACECWSASRAILYQASANGPKSPEGWAAAQIYSFLEELELASRPDREPNPAAVIAYASGHSSDIPARFRWPTRTDSE